jgi:hypothetical protein
VTQENRSPLDDALDVFVYAPVGLALTAIEEFPKLAEKGRAQIQGQVTIARMVGQFAVAQGRKQIERRLGPTGGTSSQRQPTSPQQSPVERARTHEPVVVANGTTARAGGAPLAEEAPPEAKEEPLESELIDSDGGYGKLSGRRTGSAQASGSSSAPVHPEAPLRPVAPSAERLAIPGYDSLSASQVVQRLAGLSRDELEAVGAYESAHRARRTILTRVNQLKA